MKWMLVTLLGALGTGIAIQVAPDPWGTTVFMLGMVATAWAVRNSTRPRE